MIFIDANIFIASYNSNDIHHSKALKLLRKIEAREYDHYFTSDYVFNEVVGVTLRKLGKEKALAIGQQILKSIYMINIDDHMLTESWDFFYEMKLGLNLVDCSNIIAMRIAGTTRIATLDREFKKVTELKVIDN